MQNQLSIFSEADACLENAIVCIRSLQFDEAEEAIHTAVQIDPLLTNLETWQKVLDLMREQMNGHPVPEFIASVWEEVRKQVEQGAWSFAEAEIADRELAGLADTQCVLSDGFLDSNHRLHSGTLQSLCGNHQIAQKNMLKSLTDDHTENSELWAQYANVLFRLRRFSEANAAFCQALFLDPFSIDYTRICMDDIALLYHRMLSEYAQKEAQVLLLFRGWLEGLWNIPKSNNPRLIQKIKQKTESDMISDHIDAIRTFTLYFYMDQATGPGEFHLEAREQMMALEPELFQTYLSKLEERQQALL